nr:NusG domain II-containing protein [uncultured Peptostreptococcus sp.]
MKKKDIILIISVIIIALGAILGNKILNSGKSDRVEIYVDNKLYKELPINEDKKIEINNGKGKNTVYIHDNGVEMLHANCPDKVCVRTGFVKKTGEGIVCLPHRVNIKIVSDNKDKKEHDVIVK